MRVREVRWAQTDRASAGTDPVYSQCRSRGTLEADMIL